MNQDRMTLEALAEIANRAELVVRNHADWSVAAAVMLAGRDVPALLAEVERLNSEKARLRAELEAAKRDMLQSCSTCQYHRLLTTDEPCRRCSNGDGNKMLWVWRGAPANTPAQGAPDETKGGGEG